MAEDDAGAGRVGALLSSAASVVAPLSLVTALLFYFGYVASRAQYAYFGIDVDTIGLSTQDFVMRSPQPLLTPLLGLLLVAVLVALATAAIRRRVDAARARAEEPGETGARGRRSLARVRRSAHGAQVAGRGLFALGAVLLAGFFLIGGWPYYSLATPLLMAFGAGLALQGQRIAALVDQRERAPRAVRATIALLLVATLFWATATLADAIGRGQAKLVARHLDDLPGVILDTKERLYLTDPQIVQETALEQEPGQMFRYRYRNLRLLIEGGGRLFLVPDRWSASDSTLVVQMDDSVRVQFRFENSPPGR